MANDFKIICLNPDCQTYIPYSEATNCPLCGQSLVEDCPACGREHYPTPFCIYTGKDPLIAKADKERQKIDRAAHEVQTRQLFANLRERWLKNRIWTKTWFKAIFNCFIPSILLLSGGYFFVLGFAGAGADNTRDAEIKLYLFLFLFSGFWYYSLFFREWMIKKLHQKQLCAMGIKANTQIPRVLEESDPKLLGLREMDIINSLQFIDHDAELLLRPSSAPDQDTLLRPAGASQTDENTLLRPSSSSS